jgi:N-acetylglucosamine kinase-like BadF-type ATPase
MHKVIIESGATKGDWRVISPSGKEVARILTGGTNVSTMKMETVCQTISDAAWQISNLGHEIEKVYFYTAGVVTPEIAASLTSTFKSIFPSAEIEISNDLVAAARAACGRNCGIVAILGTGSNSCLWDGEKIIQTVRSGGFILGDEGSAAALGKAFIADLIKGLVPEHIAEDFGKEYDSSYESIVENVYRSKSSPSAYLGEFARFIMRYYESEEYIRNLVEDNFRAFIQRSLKKYDTTRNPVGIIGGFGCALKDIFSRIAQEEGIRVSGFHSSPIEGLIVYHQTR